MPPDTTLDYTLIPQREYPGNPDALVDYLMDISLQFEISAPAGQNDVSQVIIIVAGDPDNINFDRDKFVEGPQRTFSNENYVAREDITGIIRIQKNQPVDIRISRIGGNPAVTWTFQGAWRKYKMLN